MKDSTLNDRKLILQRERGNRYYARNRERILARASEKARSGIALTHEELVRQLDYDPTTGIFRWKSERKRGIATGTVAGYADKRGCIAIRVNRHLWLAHRLAWLYVYGSFPQHSIDHINGDPGDNRISNLRDVPHKVNQQNRRRPNKNNVIGILGVSRAADTGKFVAAVTVDGQAVKLGSFETAQQAHEAYVAAKRELHEGCTL